MDNTYKQRLRDCVTEYIAQGWQVIPLCYPQDGLCTCGRDCKHPGKEPHYRLCPNGSKDATRDESTVGKWFDSPDLFNIGIVAGKESGLVILDVDIKESLDKLLKKHGKIEHTPLVATGRGGYHYYFKHPMDIDVRNSASKIADGIDVRGHHGYVVAPPSMHACGVEYKWLCDPRRAKPIDMPSWVNNGDSSKNKTALQDDTPIPEGKRDNTLVSMAGSMRRSGFSEEAIYNAISLVNQKRCQPPKPDEDLRRIAKSISKYEPETDKIVLKDDLPDTIAEAFEQWSIDTCKVKHRYNRFDGWSIFVNNKYQRVDDINEIKIYIRKYISQCWFAKGKGKARIKQSSGFISDILAALSSLKGVHLLPKLKAPQSLDNTLNARKIIAANNTLINIDNYPHTTHDITIQFYTFNYLTYNYIKGAYPDKWMNFLIDITLGDADLMLLLQLWCGYLLLPTLAFQKFLLCVGDGANGKGVFFDTIAAALGQNNVSNVPLARFDNAYALYGTYGKLVNMSNENAREMENNAESIIKEYVAGDKILWEQKYKDAFFDYPTAKLMFATNELPRIKDATDGIWRRMILVPFEAKFKGEQQNINLAKELQEPQELAGILNWMIEGAQILEARGGFIEPEKCKNAIERYRDESDSARLFLRDNLEPEKEEDSTKIPCTWLHQQYQKWCDNNGFKAKNNVHFGQSVHQMFSVSKSRPYYGNTKINVYVGLKFQNGSEIEQEFQKWTP